VVVGAAAWGVVVVLRAPVVAEESSLVPPHATATRAMAAERMKIRFIARVLSEWGVASFNGRRTDIDAEKDVRMTMFTPVVVDRSPR
jgi:hypothetical protein